MNLPNKITIVRIVLIPFIIFFYLSSSFIYPGKLIAAGLFLIGILTDFLDGYLARKNNQITVLGTFLDSIADKMIVTTALILLICDGTIIEPWGALTGVIIIAREFIVSALRQLAASKNVIIAADMWGKVKATFQFFAMFFFMIFSFFKDNNILNQIGFNIMGSICYLLLIVTVISTLMSGIHYLVKNKEAMKQD